MYRALTCDEWSQIWKAERARNGWLIAGSIPLRLYVFQPGLEGHMEDVMAVNRELGCVLVLVRRQDGLLRCVRGKATCRIVYTKFFLCAGA